MVVSYLEKLKKQYLQEEFAAEKKMEELQLQLRENVELIQALEEAKNSEMQAFAPWEVNGRHEKKIHDLLEEQKIIQEKIEQQRLYQMKCVNRLEELRNVLTEAREANKKESLEMSEAYRTALLETQENERQRISRELHDDTVQNLTSLIHKTELCAKLVDRDTIRCKLELSILSKSLREIIDETRQMIYDLRPMSFDDIGLDITIEHALKKIELSESKKINFIVEGEPYQIKPVIGITLLRIIQEGCRNAIRHSDCSYIQVILNYTSEMICVQIEDDGKGFDKNQLNEKERDDNSGFGLSMMRERVYLLSGNIEIDTKVNGGTKIIVNVPIRNKEEN